MSSVPQDPLEQRPEFELAGEILDHPGQGVQLVTGYCAIGMTEMAERVSCGAERHAGFPPGNLAVEFPVRGYAGRRSPAPESSGASRDTRPAVTGQAVARIP